MFKKALFLGILGTFLSLNAFGAGEFDAMNDIIGQGDTAGRQALGTGLTWFFALALPIICILTGTIMGYTQQKKKAEQQESTTKLYLVTALSAVVGFVIYLLIVMLISKALLGDNSKLFDVIHQFFLSSLGI